MHLSVLATTLVLAASVASGAGDSTAHSGSAISKLHRFMFSKKSTHVTAGVSLADLADDNNVAIGDIHLRDLGADIDAEVEKRSFDPLSSEPASGRRSRPRRLSKHKHDRRETPDEHSALEARDDLERTLEKKRFAAAAIEATGMKKRKPFGNAAPKPLASKKRASIKVPVGVSDVGNGNNVAVGGVDLDKLKIGTFLNDRAVNVVAPVTVTDAGNGNNIAAGGISSGDSKVGDILKQRAINAGVPVAIKHVGDGENIALGGIDFNGFPLGDIIKERALSAQKRGEAVIPVSVYDILDGEQIAIGGVTLKERALEHLHARNIPIAISVTDALDSEDVAIGGISLKERAAAETKRGGLFVPINIADVLNSENVAVGGVTLHKRALDFLKHANVAAPVTVADILNGDNVAVGGVVLKEKRDVARTEIVARALEAQKRGSITVPVQVSDILDGNKIGLGGVALKKRALKALRDRNHMVAVSIRDILASSNALAGSDLRERAETQQERGDVTLPVNVADVLSSNHIVVGGVALKERAYEFVRKYSITVPVAVSDVLDGNNVAVGGVILEGVGLKKRAFEARKRGEIDVPVLIGEVLHGDIRVGGSLLGGILRERALAELEKRSIMVPVAISDLLNGENIAIGGVNLRERAEMQQKRGDTTLPINAAHILRSINTDPQGQMDLRRSEVQQFVGNSGITVPISVSDILDSDQVAVGGVFKKRDLAGREIMLDVSVDDLLTRGNEDALNAAFGKRCVADLAIPVTVDNVLNQNKVAAGGVNTNLGKRDSLPSLQIPVDIQDLLKRIDSETLAVALARRSGQDFE